MDGAEGERRVAEMAGSLDECPGRLNQFYSSFSSRRCRDDPQCLTQ